MIHLWVPKETGREEMERWIEAVQWVVCSAYAPTNFVKGIRLPEYCSHSWCPGAVDVYNRVMTGD